MAKIARKLLLAPVLAGALVVLPIGSEAAPLPSNCT